LRELISSHNKEEPFADLPDSIRIYMRQLADRLKDDAETFLTPLATTMSEIVIQADRKTQKQQRYTVWSFYITAVSLILGIGSLAFTIAQLNNTAPLKAANSPAATAVQTNQ